METPKEETPKVETPKEETPKVETPKEETPKVETPKEETPKEETPKVNPVDAGMLNGLVVNYKNGVMVWVQLQVTML